MNILRGLEKFLTYIYSYKVTNTTTKPVLFIAYHIIQLIFTHKITFICFFMKNYLYIYLSMLDVFFYIYALYIIDFVHVIVCVTSTACILHW